MAGVIIAEMTARNGEEAEVITTGCSIVLLP
jgi:hypothetical protein